MSVIDSLNVPDGMVLITQEEFDKLWDDFHFLNCLRNAGVDNWQGYEEAQQMYADENEDEADV